MSSAWSGIVRSAGRSGVTRRAVVWDWGQYHARGIPDLHVLQRILQALLVAGAVVVAFVPGTSRRFSWRP